LKAWFQSKATKNLKKEGTDKVGVESFIVTTYFYAGEEGRNP
jgi:hypothetical protein